MRSTFCHMPSWQYISNRGSVGENSRWFTQSVECRSILMCPGLLAVRPRRQPDGEQHHGNARRQSPLHHRALVFRLHIGPAQRRVRGGGTHGSGRTGGRSPRCSLRARSTRSKTHAEPSCRRGKKCVRSIRIAARTVRRVIRSRAQRLVRIHAGDAHPRRQVDQLGHRAGVGVRLVNRIAARHRVHAREEDAVGLVPHNDGARPAAESEAAPASRALTRLPARRGIHGCGRRRRSLVRHQHPRRHRRQVQHANSVRRVVHHLLVVRRERIHVEVECARIRLVRDAPHAVPGVLVDPALGRHRPRLRRLVVALHLRGKPRRVQRQPGQRGKCKDGNECGESELGGESNSLVCLNLAASRTRMPDRGTIRCSYDETLLVREE